MWRFRLNDDSLHDENLEQSTSLHTLKIVHHLYGDDISDPQQFRTISYQFPS